MESVYTFHSVQSLLNWWVNNKPGKYKAVNLLEEDKGQYQKDVLLDWSFICLILKRVLGRFQTPHQIAFTLRWLHDPDGAGSKDVRGNDIRYSWTAISEVIHRSEKTTRKYVHEVLSSLEAELIDVRILPPRQKE